MVVDKHNNFKTTIHGIIFCGKLIIKCTCRDQIFVIFQSSLGHLPGMSPTILLHYQVQHGIQLPHHCAEIVANISDNFSDQRKNQPWAMPASGWALISVSYEPAGRHKSPPLFQSALVQFVRRELTLVDFLLSTDGARETILKSFSIDATLDKKTIQTPPVWLCRGTKFRIKFFPADEQTPGSILAGSLISREKVFPVNFFNGNKLLQCFFKHFFSKITELLGWPL